MFNNYRVNDKKKGANRPPLCTLMELSKSTGIPYGTLYRRMSSTKSPPDVVMMVKTNKYYEISQLKKWLQSYT